jgi:hypothetical protein
MLKQRWDAVHFYLRHPDQIFQGEDNHRAIEMFNESPAKFWQLLLFKVNDICFREIIIFKAGQPDAVRQINVMAVH